ncbi:hypothetical protein DMI70_17265 [Escherichia coli]|nr:hypothetical protein [Escherichia coli]
MVNCMLRLHFQLRLNKRFRAGGHGVLKGGSARMPDNQVNGVDFVLPFRFADGACIWGLAVPLRCELPK